jgi:hypothetical protein
MVIAFVLALAAADANTTVPAPADAAIKGAAEKKPDPFPLKGSVSATNYVGSGTFNTAPFNPTIGTDLTLSPSAKIGDIGLSLRQGFGIEWTDSDSATYARQVSISDMALNASYAKLKLEDLDIAFNFGGGVDIPLSMVSRNAGKLTSLRGSAGATWTHSSGFTAGVTANAGYTLAFAQLGQRFASQPVRPYVDDLGNTVTPTASCLLRSQDELDTYVCSPIPSVFGFATTLNLGYSMLDGQLSFNGSLGYAAGTTGFAPNDEFTSPNASTVPVLRQRWSADVSASYNVTPWFVLTGGLNSGPPVLTSLTTNGGVRTPFFDFFLPERYNNFSSVYVDANFNF